LCLCLCLSVSLSLPLRVCVCTRFLSYEKYKSGLKRGGMREDVCNLLAGSAAGMTAVVTTYPLDLVRARLAKQQVPKVCCMYPPPHMAPKRLPFTRLARALCCPTRALCCRTCALLSHMCAAVAHVRCCPTRALCCPLHSLVHNRGHKKRQQGATRRRRKGREREEKEGTREGGEGRDALSRSCAT